MIEGFAYFPAIVYRDEQPDFVGKILSTSLNYLKNDYKENVTNQTCNLNNEPVMKELINYIIESSKNILSSQGYSVEKYDFYIQGIWAQEVRGLSGTNVHVHKNSQISGWFFLETPVNGAYPIYYDTRNNKNMIELDFEQTDEITNATNSIHFNNIKPGTILFNNSWMQHQLNGGSSKDPTRCIHFIVAHKDR